MTRKRVRISVVVPAFEEAAGLGEAVGLLAHRSDVAEVIVVDASRSSRNMAFYDGAASTAQSLVRTGVRFVGVPRAGRAAQMNIGASLSSGDVILFLHADSRLPDEDLRTLLSAAMPSPGWGRFDVRFDRREWWGRVISSMMNQRARLTGIATGDQAIFLSRAVWDSCGGYADMPLMEDVDLCRRLARSSRPYRVRARVITSARRWRRDGVVRTVLLMWRLRFLFWCGADPHRLAGMYRDAR